jgi:hypothetical protein
MTQIMGGVYVVSYLSKQKPSQPRPGKRSTGKVQHKKEDEGGRQEKTCADRLKLGLAGAGSASRQSSTSVKRGTMEMNERFACEFGLRESGLHGCTMAIKRQQM